MKTKTGAIARAIMLAICFGIFMSDATTTIMTTIWCIQTIIWSLIALGELNQLHSYPFTDESILDEMDADMKNSGITQGEIESCKNHWRNKYLIERR
jgi:hypothetical protein